MGSEQQWAWMSEQLALAREKIKFLEAVERAAGELFEVEWGEIGVDRPEDSEPEYQALHDALAAYRAGDWSGLEYFLRYND